MRRLFLSSLFSRWVLPLRLIGVATTLLGLSFVVLAADAAAIVIAVLGALIWQAGTLLEERSAGFRRLKETSARDVMLTERIDVPSWLKVARVRESFSSATDRAFFVTLQDGYQSGIVLPAQLRAVSDEDARHLSVSQVARQITDLNAIHEDEPLLDAFEKMARRRLPYVTVLSFSGRLVGVVMGKDLAILSPDRTPVSEGRLDSPSNVARIALKMSAGSQDGCKRCVAGHYAMAGQLLR